MKKLLLILCLLLPVTAWGSPMFSPPIQTLLDDAGNPCAGCTLYFYENETSTPKAVYSDNALTTPAGTSITTDSAGRYAVTHFDGVYRVTLKDADGNILWGPEDNCRGFGSYVLGFDLLSNYASNSLVTAVATIGATETTLYLDADTTLTADVVVPATLSLVGMNGNAITMGSWALTINGSLQPSPSMFALNGTGDLAIGGAMNDVMFQVFNETSTGSTTLSDNSVTCSRPEWWGGGASASAAANSLAIQAAVDAFTAGKIKLSHGSYSYDTTITLDNYKHLLGISNNNDEAEVSGTILSYTGAATGIKFEESGAFIWMSSVEDLRLVDAGTGAVGIQFSGAQDCKVKDVRITGFTDSIDFAMNSTYASYNNDVLNCDLRHGTIGIDASSAQSLNENTIRGGRIREMSSYWIKIGDATNDYYPSSWVIDDVNFVDVGYDGTSGSGIYIYGVGNMVSNCRMEQSSNFAGTQKAVEFPAGSNGSWGNYLFGNDIVSGYFDTLVDGDDTDNMIFDRNVALPINLRHRTGPVDYYLGSVNTYSTGIGFKVSTNDASHPFRLWNYTDGEPIVDISIASGGVGGIVQCRGFAGDDIASNASGAVTINANSGMVHIRTITGAIASVTFSNPKAGHQLYIVWIDDGSGAGSRIANVWPVTTKLIGGSYTGPGDGQTDVQHFVYDSENTAWVEISRETNLSAAPTL